MGKKPWLEHLLARAVAFAPLQQAPRFLSCSHSFPAAGSCSGRHYDYAQVGEASGEAGRGRYQHALLGLSDLHASFGHTHEALNALSEAMSTAQQAGDQASLSRCLASLQRVMAEAPGAPGLPGGGRLGAHWEQLLALLAR